MSKGRDIRGLTIEIGGDTTGLQNSLKNVNSQIKTTQAQLKDINNLLKLDPANTELLQQKQKALADEISSTKEKLEALKTAEQQAQQQFAEGKISQQQYDALKREIIATEESLKSLETEAKNAPTQMQQSIDGLNTKIKTTQTELKEIDKLLKLDPTNTELLQQKQRALSDEIGNTKDELELLKNEEQEVQQKFQEGKVSQEQYDALKRTIIETEESLKSLENEVGSGSAKLAQISTEAGKIGENLTTAGEKMLPVTAAITGIGTCLCICDQCICLGLCILKDSILIADDLLITFDLVWSLKTKFTKKLFDFFFIHYNLSCRKWLIFTTVYIFFDFFNDLFNSAAHSKLSLFYFFKSCIFFLTASVISGGANLLRSPS